MDDDAAPGLTIGQVAQRVGVPVRTVRFWSDEGLVEPVVRSSSGYRTYGVQAVAGLDLVRTLRELGLGLPAIRALLAHRTTVAEVAAEHAHALDAQLRLLTLRRALLRHLATTASTDPEELPVMHDLTSLSVQERQAMLDDFVRRVFEDLPPEGPGAGIAAGMRSLPADLPQDPTPEQVSAWLELAGLVQDPDFADRVRQIALAGPAATPEDPDALGVDAGRLQTMGRRALAEGIVPGSEDAEALVTELLDDERPSGPDRRHALADRLATFTDVRVERYWTLLGVLNDWPTWEPSTPAVQWWIEALHAG